jgi:hypothetical protein
VSAYRDAAAREIEEKTLPRTARPRRTSWDVIEWLTSQKTEDSFVESIVLFSCVALSIAALVVVILCVAR